MSTTIKQSNEFYLLLRQCYHEMQTEREFDPIWWILKLLAAIAQILFGFLGYILIVIAYTLIVSIAASGFLITLPLIADPNQTTSLWFIFNFLLGKFQSIVHMPVTVYYIYIHIPDT